MNAQQQPQGDLRDRCKIALKNFAQSLDTAGEESIGKLLGIYRSHYSETVDGVATSEKEGDFSLDERDPLQAQRSELRKILEDQTTLTQLAVAISKQHDCQNVLAELKVSSPESAENSASPSSGSSASRSSGKTGGSRSKWGRSSSGSSSNVIRATTNGDLVLGRLEDDFTLKCDESGEPIVLGKGGMGVVMVGAPTISGPERALKICLHPSHEPRMLREFEVLSRLNVEHYANAERLYRDKDGRLCYSMKLVEGASLLDGYKAFHAVAADSKVSDTDHLDFIEDFLLVSRPDNQHGYRPQDLDEVFKALLDKLIAVATAISVMHREGYIHRDLKPENVRIEYKTREAVILDLGLAKYQDSADLESDTIEFNLSDGLTSDGTVVGTFGYMSPEQAQGDPSAHTYATDIYALGAMLHHLITGKPAVSEVTPSGKPRPKIEIVMQIRNGEVEPPVRLPVIQSSYKDLKDLEAICKKAMQKNPRDRYHSVTDLIRDLKAWRSGNPVHAYRESASFHERTRYDFHHWCRINPGRFNVIKAASLAILTTLGGGGAFRIYQHGKARDAAVDARTSLHMISSRTTLQIKELLQGFTVQTLPKEKLDQLIGSGQLSRALKDARGELQERLLTSSDLPIHRYADFNDPSLVIQQAKAEDRKLAKMEKAFEARSADRRLAKSHLEAFRAEFRPIRDFLGNDVEVKLSETSQERLDNALARYLNVFMQAPKRSVATDAPQLYFPDCSQDVQRLMSELDAQELTQAEVREIKSAVGILLSYKVLTLQRSRATGFAPQVAPLLNTCNQYLEDARHLKGQDPSVFDLILWWRVAAARNDPRAQELQNTIRTFAEQALAGEGTFTSNDLGILAKDLYEQYRFADAQKLYSLILSQKPEGDQERALFIPSRYLGELGRALSVGSMAQQTVNLGNLSAAREQLSEAAWAFESARTTLNLLPEDGPDLKLKFATVSLGLARIEMLNWKISQDGKHLDSMRRHHSDARALARGPLLSANIAQDLHNVSQFQEAASEFSQAIGAAPYLANELKPKRACCHAQLGQQDEMLDDIESILTNAASNSSTEQPLPINLTTSAMAVGVYLSRWGDKLESEERGFLLEIMRELLKQTEKRCAQGARYTLPQLQLDSAYFAPLKESDPVFWAEFERSVSLTASFSTAAK